MAKGSAESRDCSAMRRFRRNHERLCGNLESVKPKVEPISGVPPALPDQAPAGSVRGWTGAGQGLIRRSPGSSRRNARETFWNGTAILDAGRWMSPRCLAHPRRWKAESPRLQGPLPRRRTHASGVSVGYPEMGRHPLRMPRDPCGIACDRREVFFDGCGTSSNACLFGTQATVLYRNPIPSLIEQSRFELVRHGDGVYINRPLTPLKVAGHFQTTT